jgi:DNA-binding XRE family transcriptional regulator
LYNSSVPLLSRVTEHVENLLRLRQLGFAYDATLAYLRDYQSFKPYIMPVVKEGFIIYLTFSMHDEIPIGDHVAAYRKSRGVSLIQHAENMGINKSTLSRLESGKLEFTLKQFAKYFLALDTRVYIAGESPDHREKVKEALLKAGHSHDSTLAIEP